MSSNSSVFRCYQTKNIGFYNVKDEDGGYIYPLQVQSMIVPMIQVANKLSSYNNPLPALQQIEEGKKPKLEQLKDLPEGSIHPHAHEIKELPAPTGELTQIELQARLEHRQKQVNELTWRDLKQEIRIPVKDEDIVIALPLSAWPRSVWNCYISRQPKCLKAEREVLKDTTLYLVSKAHPESEDPWVEWRLSFSMPEIKIISSLPYIYRKIYIIAKVMLKSRFHKGMLYASYVAKTIFLWKCEEWMKEGRKPNEDNQWWFLLDMLKKVVEVYEEKKLPHYFLPQMNLLETFPVEKRDSVLKTVEVAKKFNSMDFLIKMVKNSSKIFQGVYIDWEDRFYFNLFYSENVVPCTRNNLREIFKRQQLCRSSQDRENWLIDILGELYHVFLYQIYVQMHFPTNILSEEDMQKSEKRKFNEAVLKQTYERIHSYTINILYAIKVFGDKLIAGEMKDVKDYYFSLRDFINCLRPVEATPVVIEDYLQRLFFDALSSGYESNIAEEDTVLDQWVKGSFDDQIYNEMQQESSNGKKNRSWECYKESIDNIWKEKYKNQLDVERFQAMDKQKNLLKDQIKPAVDTFLKQLKKSKKLSFSKFKDFERQEANYDKIRLVSDITMLKRKKSGESNEEWLYRENVEIAIEFQNKLLEKVKEFNLPQETENLGKVLKNSIRKFSSAMKPIFNLDPDKRARPGEAEKLRIQHEEMLEEKRNNIVRKTKEFATEVVNQRFFELDKMFRSLIDLFNSEQQIKRRMKFVLSQEKIQEEVLKKMKKDLEENKIALAQLDENCDASYRLTLKSNIEGMKQNIERQNDHVYNRCYVYNQLMMQQMELFNYGFTSSKFALPSPATYMLYLVQYRVVYNQYRKGLKGVHQVLYKMKDWGYHVINDEGRLEFVSNYQKKHKAFIRGIDLFSNQPSSTITIKPYQYLRPSFSDIDVGIMDCSYNSFG